MPTPLDRKKAKQAYKEQDTIGGIYRIHNRIAGTSTPYMATTNLYGKRNGLQFAKNMNTAFLPQLSEDWQKYGGDAFEFEEIEQLKKNPDQTLAEFRKDLAALLEMHQAAEAEKPMH